jgi:acetyl esterase/lipase
MMRYRILVLLMSVFTAVFAQPPEKSLWTLDLLLNYSVDPNITYSVASNYECRLDVYARNSTAGPVPTVLFIHGGGWVVLSKEVGNLYLLPWMEMGYSVVNVDYRLTKVAHAPAAVEDCRIALRWVIQHAKTYNFDTTRIVVTGMSAGGHLALMTGMLDPAAGFDATTEWDESSQTLRVAAVVNWYGITDVKDMLAGQNRRNYAVSWIGSQADPEKLAARVSPITYARKGLPPILTIHGTDDNFVPYSQAVRLHKALTEQGVQNQLLTIQGGHHGGFTREEMTRIYSVIREFLKRNGLLP